MAKQKPQKASNHRGGMPAGHKTAKTIEKEAARSALRQIVLEQMRPLVEAQIANAMGIKYLVLRDKRTGKFTKLTKEAADKLLEANDDDSLALVEVWEKDPSVQAFTDLMNRAIDKPIEQQEHFGELNHTFRWLGAKD